ncbi:hypothetical protein [Aeromonas dhakensis]|uniref:hypothetical protein n=1 Tax=Aeromonas dhakensis TaxID=196024 RepID=UPI00100856CF|nr:hypothetical protein [Aeromonas dhakensis]
MSAVIPAHGSLPSPRLFRQPGQGDAASKPPHPPLARSETLHRAIATCTVSSPSLPSSGHVPATSSPYQYLIEPPTCREKSRTGSVQWLRDRHQPQDFCKFTSVLPPESGVTTGKNPRSTTRNAGGRENGADSSPNHARLTPSPAKLSVFADKILKNQKKPHIRPINKYNENKFNTLILLNKNTIKS